MQCKYNTSGCPGSNNNNCYPDGVWASAVSGNLWGYRLKSGSFNLTFNSSAYATGVRCVLDLNCRQLCDNYSGKGALQCQNLSGGCPGSSDNNCYPNYVWSGTADGSNYYNFNLNSGTFNQNSHVPTRARSVRCVLDLNLCPKLRTGSSVTASLVQVTARYSAGL